MTMHTALVAVQSPALRNLVSGSMEEAQTGKAIWEDTSEETFALFAQFVYTGDYTPPSHVLEQPEASDAAEPAAAGNADQLGNSRDEKEYEIQGQGVFASSPQDVQVTGLFGSSYQPTSRTAGRKISKKEQKQNGRGWSPQSPAVDAWGTPLASSLFSRDYPPHTVTMRVDPRPNTSPSEDYTLVFLGHARLYVFADTYGIESLKATVLNKLQRTLNCFSLYESRYRDIIELVRYAYENTPTRDGRGDELRELVAQYVAYGALNLAKSKLGLDLVEENGAYARDFTRFLLERMTNERS